MQKLIEKLHSLADRWDRMAMKQVPPEYAERNLHGKYLRLDNEAAGLSNCAEELRELLNIESHPEESRKRDYLENARKYARQSDVEGSTSDALWAMAYALMDILDAITNRPTTTTRDGLVVCPKCGYEQDEVLYCQQCGHTFARP